MKIKYLKDINGFKVGDVDDVPDERANYFIRVGAAEESKEEKPKAEKKVTEKKSPAKKKSK